jgi:transcriptional regulator with GAF, ATPase, and Fis domain
VPLPQYIWPLVVQSGDRSAQKIREALSSLPCIQLHEESSVVSKTAPGLIVSLRQTLASPEELTLIQEFHNHGSRVICCIPGLSGQSLAERCKLLLAGANEILDEHDSLFADNLRSTVETLAAEECQRFAELHRIKALMSDAGIAGSSAALIEVFRSLERLAPFSDLPVLIIGETGTGKELFARAVYNLDPRRRAGPFVAINCASLPDGLSESELFGFRRGAFTGADRDRAGAFRSAHQGVLFLDEVGELSAAAQTKLLRVLQTSRVVPLGDDREIEVDIRVVAATNRDLEAMVKNGTFRDDLFHRLNVLRLSLPPLRERPEDIAPLAEHFAAKYRHLSQGTPMRFTPDFVEAIQSTSLPGNVRQLENLIRKALLSTERASALSLQHLPRDLWNELASRSKHTTARADEKPRTSFREFAKQHLEKNGWNLTRSVEQFERELVDIALEEANGNQSEAARRLGITARSVYNKLHDRRQT